MNSRMNAGMRRLTRACAVFAVAGIAVFVANYAGAQTTPTSHQDCYEEDFRMPIFENGACRAAAAGDEAACLTIAPDEGSAVTGGFTHVLEGSCAAGTPATRISSDGLCGTAGGRFLYPEALVFDSSEYAGNIFAADVGRCSQRPCNFGGSRIHGSRPETEFRSGVFANECRLPRNSEDCWFMAGEREPIYDPTEDNRCRPAANQTECATHFPNDNDLRFANGACTPLNQAICAEDGQILREDQAGGGPRCSIPENISECEAVNAAISTANFAVIDQGVCAESCGGDRMPDPMSVCREIRESHAECLVASATTPIMLAGGFCVPAANAAACVAAHSTLPIRQDNGSCIAAADNAACIAAHPTLPIRQDDGSCAAAADNAACLAAYPMRPIRQSDGSCIAAVDDAACLATYPMRPIRQDDGSCAAAADNAACLAAHPTHPIWQSDGSCIAAANAAVCLATYPMRPIRLSDGSCIAAADDAACLAAHVTLPIRQDDGSCAAAADNAACIAAHVTLPFRQSDGSCAAAADSDICLATYPMRPIRQPDGSCVAAVDDAACIAAHVTLPIRQDDGSCAAAANSAACLAAHPTNPISGGDGSCIAAADSAACIAAHPALPISRGDGSCAAAADSAACLAAHPAMPIRLPDGRCVAAASNSICRINHPTRPIRNSDGLCRISASHEECRENYPLFPIRLDDGQCIAAADSAACFGAFGEDAPALQPDGSCGFRTQNDCAPRILDSNSGRCRPASTGSDCIRANLQPLIFVNNGECVSECPPGRTPNARNNVCLAVTRDACLQEGRIFDNTAETPVCRSPANIGECASMPGRTNVIDSGSCAASCGGNRIEGANSICRDRTQVECAPRILSASTDGVCRAPIDAAECVRVLGSIYAAIENEECVQECSGNGRQIADPQNGDRCRFRTIADCTEEGLYFEAGRCRAAATTQECREAGLGEVIHPDTNACMPVVRTDADCRDATRNREIAMFDSSVRGELVARNGLCAQECADGGLVYRGMCALCADGSMHGTAPSLEDCRCPGGEIPHEIGDGGDLCAPPLPSSRYDTAECEGAGWDWERRRDGDSVAEICKIRTAVSTGVPVAQQASAGDQPDDCVLRRHQGYSGSSPMCTDPMLFGRAGLPAKPQAFNADDDRLNVVYLGSHQPTRVAFSGAPVPRYSLSPPSQEGDPQFSSSEAGALYLAAPVAAFVAYSLLTGEPAYTPEFGWQATEDSVDLRYGGRMDWSGDKWTSYLTASGESGGGMTYETGGRYDAGLWTASYATREGDGAGDYDFALSTEWRAGRWEMKPNWHVDFAYAKEKAWESSSGLNLDALWRAHKWTVRPQAAFAWESNSNSSAPSVRVDIERAF